MCLQKTHQQSDEDKLKAEEVVAKAYVIRIIYTMRLNKKILSLPPTHMQAWEGS